MDYKNIFLHQEKILQLELGIARERFNHYGLRGDAVESAIRDFIERHIPRSLTVGTGEVIALESDSGKQHSSQIDIVISNMSQPFIAARDTPTTFFIEGVHAAGEVKTVLDRSHTLRELEKSEGFRGLRAQNTSRLIEIAGQTDWTTYYIYHRPYFILSMETKGDWQSILWEIMKYIKYNKKIPVDALFLIDRGIAIFISPLGKLPMSNNVGIPFSHRIADADAEGSINIYHTDTILALFMAWMTCFRTSFFEDKHTLAFYIDKTVNSSMEELLFMDMSSEETQKFMKDIENLPPFEVIFNQFQRKYGD